MTNQQLKALIIAALAAVAGLCLTALLIWGPQDVQTQITEGAAALVAWLTVGGGAAYLLRDRDGDGIPDIIQPGGLLGPKATSEHPDASMRSGRMSRTVDPDEVMRQMVADIDKMTEGDDE